MKELSRIEMTKITGAGMPIGFLPFLEFVLICIKNGLTNIVWDDDSWLCY